MENTTDPFEISDKNLKKTVTDGTCEFVVTAVTKVDTSNDPDGGYRAVDLMLQPTDPEYHPISTRIFLDDHAESEWGLLVNSVQTFCKAKAMKLEQEVKVPSVDDLVGAHLLGVVMHPNRFYRVSVIRVVSLAKSGAE